VAKTGLTIKIKIEGVRETLRGFNALPKNANDALKDRTKEIAAKVAQSAKDAGVRAGSQAALVSRSVKVKRDRVPAVQAGGSSPALGRYGAPPSALLFGSEFGMNAHSGWYHQSRYNESAGSQYHPHTGRVGAWFFPTVEREAPAISDAWNRAADDIVGKLIGTA
jgi:hypothetical protein